MKNLKAKSAIIILLSIFTLSFFGSFTNAQVAQYTFSQSNGTFVPVIFYGPQALFFPSWDDEQVTANVNQFSFTFKFAGIEYTTVTISTNGFLVFGSTLINNAAGGAYVSASDPSGLYLGGTSSNNGVAGMNMNWQEQTFPTFTGTIEFFSDVITNVSSFANLKPGMRLIGNGIQNGTVIADMNPGAQTITMSFFGTSNSTVTITPASSISANTIGSAPNRTCVVQYIAVKRSGSVGIGDNVSFQIRLNEGGPFPGPQTIDVVYGTATTTQTTNFGAQSGLRTASSDFNSRTDSLDWTMTESSITNTDRIRFKNTVFPPSGLTFTWTPPVLACDISPVANLNPNGNYNSVCGVIAPKASFKNLGTATPTGINVSYIITGPSSYLSTKTISSLAPNTTTNITFDSTFNPIDTGTYNVKIISSLPCDTTRINDTLRTTFRIGPQANFGGPLMSCSYFFANSTVCSNLAPNKPVFYWEDTTGSTSLLIDSTIVNPAIYNGSKDNGHWRLGNIFPSGVKFRFCGVDYDSFFVSSNGVIALTKTGNTDSQINSPPFFVSLPSPTIVKPALFPLWMDFDNGYTATGSRRLSYKVTDDKLILTYARIPFYIGGYSTVFVSFQVILEISNGPIQNGNIIFQYDMSGTGTEFLIRYFDQTLESHVVGIQDQTGTGAIQYRKIYRPAGQTFVYSYGPLFTSSVAVAFGPNQNVLPVELASFISIVDKRNVTLNWTTQIESNNSGFEIERSNVKGETSNDWIKIGFVQGNGTSTTPTNYSFTDRGLNSGKYNYRLKQVDLNGNFKYFSLSNEVGIGIPISYALTQNYPNPFNPITKIDYDLPYDGKVSILLYDILGREVAKLVNEVQTAGYYTVDINATNLSSGAYFYKINAEGNGQQFEAIKKMIFMK